MFNDKTNLYEGYIYSIENKETHQKYIGQTTRNIKVRWNEHLSKSRKYKISDKKSVLYENMQRDGYERYFITKLEMIEATDKKQLIQLLNEKEQYYIRTLKTLYPDGYNYTPGGGQDGYLGRKQAWASYNLDGTFCKAYESGLEVYYQLGVTVDKKVLEKYRIQNKLIWIPIKNINEYPVNVEPYVGGLRTRFIVQVDNSGNVVNCFDSIVEASVKTGINNVLIGDCINNRYNRLTAGGYRWFQLPFGTNVLNLKYEKYIPKRNYV